MSDAALLTATVFTVFDNAGVMVPGALIHTYVAGTSTPLATFSDPGLTIANANPVVCDSAGRATIYLQNQAYKIVVATAADVTLYTQDNVSGSPVGIRAVCNGRMTLVSGSPVADGNGLGNTTLYWTPYQGNWIALYTGTAWLAVQFSELSLGFGVDGNGNYDLFAYLNAGAATLERLAWTNDTTRATALGLQDGVLVKSTDHTRRYLGTYRIDSAASSFDTTVKRFVWNYYNRVPRLISFLYTANSWTYTTATYRQANADANVQVAVVVGVQESLLTLDLQVTAANSGPGAAIVVGIGQDSTTTPLASLLSVIDTDTANSRVRVAAHAEVMPTAGYHFYAWLEYSTAIGTTTWYGNGGAATLIQSGLQGWIPA